MLDFGTIAASITAGKAVEMAIAIPAVWIWRKLRQEENEGEKSTKEGVYANSGENYNVFPKRRLR
jgi:hypothetical protein